MKKLLKFELRKLMRGKLLYISAALVAVLAFVSLLILKATQGIVDPMFRDEFSRTGTEEILLAVDSSYFMMVAGIFVAVFVCDDYTQQTLKNIYARGYTRINVTLSKLIATVLASSAIYFLSVLSGFVFASLIFETGEANIGELLSVFSVQYISVLANIFLFFALSVLIKKKGLAVAAVILVPFVSELLLSLLDLMLMFENAPVFSEYWLTTFPSDLTNVDVPDKKLLVCLFGSLVYIAVFAFLGNFFNRKSEA